MVEDLCSRTRDKVPSPLVAKVEVAKTDHRRTAPQSQVWLHEHPNPAPKRYNTIRDDYKALLNRIHMLIGLEPCRSFDRLCGLEFPQLQLHIFAHSKGCGGYGPPYPDAANVPEFKFRWGGRRGRKAVPLSTVTDPGREERLRIARATICKPPNEGNHTSGPFPRALAAISDTPSCSLIRPSVICQIGLVLGREF